MLALAISISYVIHLCILHHALPNSVLYCNVLNIFILFRSDSSTEPKLYLRLYLHVCAYYKGVFIFIFVYVIQYNCWLCLVLGIWFYISPIYGLFPTVLLLHSQLY